MDTRQTKPAYLMKIIHQKTSRAELKEYMMNKFEWNGQFGLRSNKTLVSKAYVLAAKKYTTKIQNLGHAKIRLDARQEKVKEVGKIVEDFLSINIRYTPKNLTTEAEKHIGRCIFSKYVLENLTQSNGLMITGRHIRNFLSPNKDVIRSATPTEWRKRFTQSFFNFPDRKRLYNDFLVYIRERNNERSGV